MPGSALQGKGYFNCVGYLTGVPTGKLQTEALASQPEAKPASSPQAGGEQIERLVRGMNGSKKWGYLVYAMPLGDDAVARETQRLIHLSTTLSVQLKQSETRSEQAQNRAVGAGGLQVVSANRTFETTRRDVQLALALLDQQIERFETGRAEGMWQTQSFFFGEDGLTATRAGGRWCGLALGAQARAPNPCAPARRAHAARCNNRMCKRCSAPAS